MLKALELREAYDIQLNWKHQKNMRQASELVVSDLVSRRGSELKEGEINRRGLIGQAARL